MNEYQRRQEAVRRHLAGEKVAQIAGSLNKSRKWLHHWINRYHSRKNEDDWYKDQSKAPKNPASKISPQTEQNILSVRKELMNEKMAQTGAVSIQYELQRRGLPVSEIWTINRVIAKHGLSTHKPVLQSPKDYPELFWHTHQLDLVGPRYIKGDGKFYSINLIDTTTHYCCVKAVRTKSSQHIVEALALFWQTHGLPDALQMDNELAFRGSNRYPRSFGAVVRFALSVGVAVVFIPVKEPWRNGMMEKFNDTYQRRFLKAFTFESFEHLQQQQQRFIDFHNSHHRYSSQSHQTPDQAKAAQLPAIFYQATLHLPCLRNKIKIPLTTGSIYYIRYIRSDLKLHLPNETFVVKPTLKYSYVVAEINIDNHSLIIRQNNEIIQVFTYPIPAVEW